MSFPSNILNGGMIDPLMMRDEIEKAFFTKNCTIDDQIAANLSSLVFSSVPAVVAINSLNLSKVSSLRSMKSGQENKKIIYYTIRNRKL